ncbi:BEL1-like homeodomain protein 1 [Tripterygium wilfordii]|uniref:BEL1-like homeodomain protein 1 n=1 Tax=Tripterygium wilfordii TaxID=458696 RepID=A0A7J7DW38_TRIWF|nr:BEL1-like homeodomain protein 1 [Tripterygium wilfordii]
MATYFHGNSEILGGDGLQTLVLMNPSYVQYHHDAPPPQPPPQQQQQPPHSNLVFLNSAANNLSSPPPQLSHLPPHQQFVGIPLPNSTSSTAPSQNPNDISALHGLIPRLHYNLFNSIDHHAPTPRDTPRAQQGLSLTLSSQQQPGYGSQQAEAASGGSASSGSGVTNGVSGLQGVLLSSKYLKAAQELLDEVVNVNGNGTKSELLPRKSNGSGSGTTKVAGESSAAGSGDGSGGGEAGEKNRAELTTAERQEFQMKKAKLVNMLDESSNSGFSYPKDSDKHMLAKQTGLTRSQNGGSDDKTSKSERNEDSASKSTVQQAKCSATVNQTISLKSKDNSTNQNAPAISMSAALSSPVGGNVRNQSGFSFIGLTELDDVTQGSPKKPRTNEMIQSPTGVPGEVNNEHVSMKFGNERQGRDGYLFMGGQNNFIGEFGQYSIGEIGRFDSEQFTPRFSGNGVSLTLGLPHCENLSLSAAHQPFLPNQNNQLGRVVDMGEPNEFGAINSTTPHSSAAYEDMEMQNRKRFVAQLLPDFVA